MQQPKRSAIFIRFVMQVAQNQRHLNTQFQHRWVRNTRGFIRRRGFAATAKGVPSQVLAPLTGVAASWMQQAHTWDSILQKLSRRIQSQLLVTERIAVNSGLYKTCHVQEHWRSFFILLVIFFGTFWPPLLFCISVTDATACRRRHRLFTTARLMQCTGSDSTIC